jgi:hypothetical protein
MGSNDDRNTVARFFIDAAAANDLAARALAADNFTAYVADADGDTRTRIPRATWPRSRQW